MKQQRDSLPQSLALSTTTTNACKLCLVWGSRNNQTVRQSGDMWISSSLPRKKCLLIIFHQRTCTDCSFTLRALHLDGAIHSEFCREITIAFLPHIPQPACSSRGGKFSFFRYFLVFMSTMAEEDFVPSFLG